MKKKAFITGITGQDGSYLAELLLQKGYEVHGLVRRSSTFNRHNIEHIFASDESKHAFLHYGDMTDFSSLMHTIHDIQPDEIYNLAAQSHVRVSFDVPYYTAQSDAVGVLLLVEAARILDLKAKIYQASTSELYSGASDQAPQNELTPFKPRSPYGAAKLYGYEIARIYRESYGMFVVNGILFNHESPRRGENFVTRKITMSVADIAKGKERVISLGNLSAQRDWGYAPEYMEAAWRMLQQTSPEDYVIATGETHSVREFVEKAFHCVDIDIVWEGEGISEKGLNRKTGSVLVDIHPEYFRPNEVQYLCGDAAKAKAILGWQPKTTFDALVEIMVKADLEKTRVVKEDIPMV